MVKRPYDYKKELEKLRKKMNEAALRYGISHPLVLKYSQELDKMHNTILNKKFIKNKVPSSFIEEKAN